MGISTKGLAVSLDPLPESFDEKPVSALEWVAARCLHRVDARQPRDHPGRLRLAQCAHAGAGQCASAHLDEQAIQLDAPVGRRSRDTGSAIEPRT